MDVECNLAGSTKIAISFSEDHAVGLSSFTIMAGLGGSLGYAMGGLNWGALGMFIRPQNIFDC